MLADENQPGQRPPTTQSRVVAGTRKATRFSGRTLTRLVPPRFQWPSPPVLRQHEEMTDLPAKCEPSGLLVPQQIADMGDEAAWRFIEFFTARIPNDNTRDGYLRDTHRFFAWLARISLDFKEVRPPHVAAYIKELETKDGLSKATIKRRLSALRMLFDYLVIGQVIPFNPTTSVQGPKLKRGPNESSQRGKTPVLSGEDARALLDSIDVSSVVGLRDRALIALMVFSFARVGAALAMDVRDYYQNGKRWYVRLHEKGGKDHEMPAHHTLEEYLDAYIEAAGIAADHNGPLFRTAKGKTKTLTVNRVSRFDAHSMIRRRATDAGITAPIGNHTFRATGITNYLENGGTLEKAQEMAAHESAKTTKLYDRRQANVTLDEVERIRI